MNIKALKTLLIATAFIGILSVSAYAASTGGTTIEVDNLNFRREATLDSSVYTTIDKGIAVIVSEKVDDDWYKVVYEGAVGYVAAEHLNFGETMEGYFGVGTIYGENVHMRESALITSDILATYDEGTEMTVLGVSGEWYKVSCGDAIGYIHSNSFALNGGISELYGSLEEYSEIGQLVVDTAMKYMGVSYVWGGTSPNGFDCSGLVYYVYQECGYSISRTAASIYDNGVYVEKSELQAGDAICFSSSSSSIGHVGIYIGEGQFIHASSGSGAVIVSDLDTTYYVNNYVGARRIV